MSVSYGTSALRPRLRESLKALVGRHIWVRLRAARIESNPTERELKLAIAIVRRFSGGVTIDVGANTGVYTIPLAVAASRLVAFDANPVMCDWLRSELPRSVTVENLALADREGQLTLRIPIIKGAEIAGMATIAAANNFADFEVDQTRQIDVQTTSLDKYAAERLAGAAVTFVKIDVEGAEDQVLRGAKGVLYRDRPVLLVETELRHGADVGAIFGDLARLEYRPFILGPSDDRLVPTSMDDVPRLQATANVPRPGGASPARYVNNFFFVPSSRLPALRDLIAE